MSNYTRPTTKCKYSCVMTLGLDYLFECYKEDAKLFIHFNIDVKINSYSEMNKGPRPIFSIADFKLRFLLSQL
ncbi:hypothetical protein TNIN_138491 [Trichonephila inaurata madagascariensis]|uniref:Uncharacterized protein n=1 Tax=Trichonephila inaurata madagascariensis TaxID=2747483 RepID=A0A8X6III5_9ARAC|nr:hypothetical protein TNIN_138491 [Trichonephila inaurata madagascariensis]